MVMKKVNYSILLLLTFLLSACEENGYVKIDTLSKYGDVYFGGQVVPVWVGVDVDERENATYEWVCDGGSFEGKTNVFRATWVAPLEKGEYTVKCTVTCNGASDTRITKMVVSEYFFDLFGVASSNFTARDVKVTYADGEAKVVGSKSNKQGLFVREISDDDFKVPFSFSYDASWRKNYKNATTPFMTWIVMKRAPDANGNKNSKYIRDIRLEVYPKASASGNNYKLSMEEYNITFGGAALIVASEGYLEDFEMPDGSKAEDGKGMRNFELFVDAENMITVKVDGKVALMSNAIREWELANQISNVLNPSRAGFKVFDKCDMYLDNVYLKKGE